MKPSVVIVGASADRKKYGNKAVRAYLAAGYDVFPVHPTEPTIEGIPAFSSVSTIPQQSFDRVTFYLSPKVGVKALDDLTGKSIRQLILNPGADGPEVVAKAQERGWNVVQGCSIIMGGYRPEQFPDE